MENNDNVMPTYEQKKETVISLRNIAGLIKTGMYLGQNAVYVNDAVLFLEKTAATIEAALRPAGLSEVPPLKEEKVEENGKA